MPNPIKLAMVDDASRYSRYLGDAVSKLLSEKVMGQNIVYLPKSKLFGKPTSSQSGFRNSKKIWSSFLYPFQIFHEAIADRVNIVHIQLEVNTFGHPITLLLLPTLLLTLRIARTQTLVTLHGVFPRSLFSEKGNHVFTEQRAFTTFFLTSMTFLYHVVSRLSSGLVVHSILFKDWLVNYNVDAEMVHVIPHGVGTDSADLDPKRINYWLEKTGRRRIVLCFGVLSPRKGLENLIRAYQAVNAKYPDTILVIAGHEPGYFRGYKRKLGNLSRELGIGSGMLFTGSISEDDIAPLFLLSEIVVLPYISSVSASGPLAIALQFAKPIVATDTLFFRNELKNGKNCMLVRRNDHVALSLAVSTLLENKVFRDQLRFGAKAAGIENSWERVADVTVKLYETLTNTDVKSTL